MLKVPFSSAKVPRALHEESWEAGISDEEFESRRL